ncbi:MAG: PIN domain-containing protein [Bacteroidetes bacterium]|nr:PIN domain-containing protein [Bacteroidota bacterium]
MNLLLDTHAFMWFINGDKSLPAKVINLIKNIENKCFISIASIWEIAIKFSLGRLDLEGEFGEISNFLNENDIEIIPITFEHIQTLLRLEYYHRDPFDRIIISQGIYDSLVIVTKDENFNNYNVKLVWK